jgi:GDSL-like Lipase/Acylhydrolase family
MKRIQRLGLIGALGLLGLWGSELLVRQLDPQEVNGWGERPSLTPDATTGWHLQPSQVTRLRWEHYDYTVTANSLGFPAPEYPVAKAANTLRIMTTGDAFTSAEGVNTEDAWPRLLERQLAKQLPGRKVEVINFAITGHGPNQYAAVIQKYAPIYRPDVILAEFFVNDFADALTTDASFREQIGFAKVPQDHWQHWLKLSHLRRFVRGRWVDPALAAMRQQPGSGEVWGHLYALEQQPEDQVGQDKLADRMAAIHQVATQIGAQVIVPMVPSSLQVCQPGQLPYYPLNGPLQQRLSDPRYDRNRPQTRIQAAAQASGLATYDLRLPLQASAQCPYHPANMHWLPAGHQAVADFLAQKLVADGWLQKVKRP